MIVTSPVSRPGDSRCDLTGGTLTQTWHWSGSRFLVIATKRTPPPVHAIEFHASTAGLNVGCEIDDSTFVKRREGLLLRLQLNGTSKCISPASAPRRNAST